MTNSGYMYMYIPLLNTDGCISEDPKFLRQEHLHQISSPHPSLNITSFFTYISKSTLLSTGSTPNGCPLAPRLCASRPRLLGAHDQFGWCWHEYRETFCSCLKRNKESGHSCFNQIIYIFSQHIAHNNFFPWLTNIVFPLRYYYIAIGSVTLETEI